MATLREESRREWGPSATGATREELALGALQRIADASEKMAVNISAVIDERERYKRWYEEERASNGRLLRRIIALRGVITRIKRRSR